MSPRRAAILRDGGGDQTLREHLVTTAARLISERGTAGLTVRDIAREAGVADGVLYNHFAGKEELLAMALHAHVHEVMAAAGEPPAPGEGTVEENLRVFIDRGLAVLARLLPAFAGLLGQPKVLVLFHGSGFHPDGGGALRAVLAGYLRTEQELGRIAADASPEAAATMVMGACHELILPRVFAPGPQEPPAVRPGFTGDLVTTVLRGIAPVPER
ncbi:TetR/AcrR family transcriptional regulator [Streptomyces sp. CMB-StM0423]|uniref:TetR/AcrR family transcriptional regulator n=1 Tax=Streptomyces sp. CMB-StM0423 TaxID=2059884 RepID=UPI000C704CA2|nr:TetR/AcrR family transcriptional regulator [Streptomyces sp. CMB-StM0423]AUH42101.1 TetR/AcrR family transcriptional regulator [Streptomyces sp. CMB-StM0423]